MPGATVLAAGARWQFSFGRYDHTQDGMGAVVSSTSPHAEPDFHRQQEWGLLEFEP
ncbi:MAG TPA: hypothetical protein PLH97_12370 [Verrucomicrobiota bacterium]|nr:hypothetical protein [Verrucomicrobiota bacterium]HPU57050.1 hypothetical protein [Verrucomicrobiota bacterium]